MARQFAAGAWDVRPEARVDIIEHDVAQVGLGCYAEFDHLPRAGCHESLIQREQARTREICRS
jgi:hypothetical protein